MPKVPRKRKENQELAKIHGEYEGATFGHTRKSKHNPPWHRQYFRRLALHGKKTKAAEEVGINYRQALRVERAKPRFAKAVRAAIRLYDQRYAEAIERATEDMALNGVEQKVYQGGQLAGTFTRYLPALTRHVLDTVAKKYRVRADAKITALRRQQESVSEIHNTLNLSVGMSDTENPEIRALLMRLSDLLTSGQAQPQQAIDVTPQQEAGPVVRADDE